jgi:hypothetical protein
MRLSAYADLQSIIEHLGGGEKGEQEVTKKINLYARQKGSLVEWRDWFTDEIERITGFAYLRKTETRKGKDGVEKQVEVPAETEAQYIDRFRKAVADGQTFELKAETAVGPVPTTLEALDNWLQAVSNQKVFVCDATAAEREPGEEKLPVYAYTNAIICLCKGSHKAHRQNVQKWKEKFTSEAGVDVSGLSEEVRTNDILKEDSVDSFVYDKDKVTFTSPLQEEGVKHWARAIVAWYKVASKQQFK